MDHTQQILDDLSENRYNWRGTSIRFRLPIPEFQFPLDAIMNQVFEEEQFEAYRAVGDIFASAQREPAIARSQGAR
jgi:hypothetical protein